MTKIKMAFDSDVAKDVGTDAAIILSNIEYWQEINRANNINFKEGRYWTYNSVKAFNEIFSYLTPRKIRTCLDKLESKGYIVSSNFNKKNYDRTKWFNVPLRTICQKRQIELSEMSNRVDENDKPIPNSKQQIVNTNNKHNTSIEENLFSLDDCVYHLQHKTQHLHKSNMSNETFNRLFTLYKCSIDKSGYITTTDKQLTQN